MNVLIDVAGALRRTMGRAGLVVLLWLVHLVLALVVALPLAARLHARLGPSPTADALLDGPSLALLVELGRAEAPAMSALAALLGVLLVAAMLLNPLLAGGTLEVLVSDDARPLGHRFGRGVGRFYGRLLRQGLVASVVTGLAVGLVVVPLGLVAGRAADAGAETRELVLRGAQVVLGGLVLVVFLLALDLARVRVVRDDAGGAVRVWWQTLGRVLRRPSAIVARWLVLAVALGVVLLLAGWLRAVIPTRGWAGIATVAVITQLGALLRAGYRVALWDCELAVASRAFPSVASENLAATPPPQPADVLATAAP